MLIDRKTATILGKRLATILFPLPVFKLLTESITATTRTSNAGLRLRLSMDDELSELPWEYLYRPDRINTTGISGFLLLDPTVSLVREKINPRISVKPITSKQQLYFMGTLWKGGADNWEVKKEFDLLEEKLDKVSGFISESYAVTSVWAKKKTLAKNTAILHYSGHCDTDKKGKGFIVNEVPTSGNIGEATKTYVRDLAKKLAATSTRLVVLSACNSGFAPIAQPLMKAGIPALIGVNGIVATQSTIEFCGKLYESLSVGLSLDESVSRARTHLIEWGAQSGMFDWGLYMVYMPSSSAILFPRKKNTTTVAKQKELREQHSSELKQTMQYAKRMDGMNFGEIMSELSNRRVLILGRFTDRRKKILEAIKAYLANHAENYIPELFTFEKPDNRDLTESIIGFAALSRFIIADLSEPRSIQAELQAIVPNFMSIPVVPIINKTGKPYALFSSIARMRNVIDPITRYSNAGDLLKKIETEVIPLAEEKLAEVRPAKSFK